MDIDLYILKDILSSFGKQIVPSLSDEDLDAAIEEYIDAERDTLLSYAAPEYEDDD